RHRPDAFCRLLLIPSLLEGIVGGKRSLDPFEEDKIVPRRPGGTAEWRDPLDHVGVERAPLVRLLRAHRPSHNELQSLDPELLRHEPMLEPHVVVERHTRESRPIIRWSRIAWRRRKSIAKHVRDYYEIPLGGQGHIGSDQPFVVVVLSGVPGR